jgi:hypothetical protein
MAKRQPSRLRVVANPFLFGGDPLCACASDPVEHIPNRYIGAKPLVTAVGEAITVGKYTGTLGGDQHEVDWHFSKEVQEIPDTKYYRDRLKDGSLVPADAETAAKAGLKFTSVEQMLAKDPNAPMQPTRKGQG